MPPIRDVLLLHHSHADVGYTNYHDTMFAMHREYLRRAMDLAEAYSDGQPGEQFKWVCEVTVLVEDFLRHARPGEVDRLLRLHQQRLIGFGGMFCHVTPLYGTELLARSLYVAADLRRQYGLDIRHALNCDVNGESWGLVDMLLDSGFEGLAMAVNRVMARDPLPRPIAFWWESPSGRRLPVWHGEEYGYGHYLGIPRVAVAQPQGTRWVYAPERAYPLVQAYSEQLRQQGYLYDFLYFQITTTFMGGDNGPPHEELVRFVRDWNARGWQPRMRIVTLDELFARLQQQPADTLETRTGDWTDWWAQGVGSSAFETAWARRGQMLLGAGETLSALLSGLPQPPRFEQADDYEAWHSLALYAEHTWAGRRSTMYPDSPNVRSGWHRKAAYAYAGTAAATRLAQAAHRDLAARLPQSDAMRILVFNSLPWPRRVPLLLPQVVVSGWENAQMERDLELASPQGPVTANIDYGVVELPAGGYITVPVSPPAGVVPHADIANPPAPSLIPTIAPGLTPTSGVTCTGWMLANRFYRLSADPTTGTIRSLVDKATGHEWVDASTPWHLGHYVYEENRSPRGRLDMQRYAVPPCPPDYDHQPELAPVRSGPQRVLAQRFVPGVGSGRLHLRLQAPSVHDLHVQIILYDDLPWIDLVFDFNKVAVIEPESVYIAFPLNLSRPTAHYEAAGAIVQAEAQQLVNACRDFYSVQNWVDLSDRERGVTVASPDAPLLHLGGFTNHKYLAHLPMEQSLLVGWPLNNHWYTNFCASQSGWTRIRYRLLPHASPFDAVVTTRFGAEAAVEPLLGPLWDRPCGMERRVSAAPVHLPEQASLLALEPAHVHLVGLKPAADGRGIIVRLQEMAGRKGDFHLHFPQSQVVAANWCNLVEEDGEGLPLRWDGHTVRGHIQPYRLQTLRLTLLA